MSNWIGIDHGTKRIGIAAGSTETGIASPVDAISDEGDISDVMNRIGEYVREYGAEGILVGLPLNMDGSEGQQSKIVREFADRLSEVVQVEVKLWDERLSSYQADLGMADALTKKQRRDRRDAIAASVFLGDFLDSEGA